MTGYFQSSQEGLRIEDFQSFDEGFGFFDFLDWIEDFFQPLRAPRRGAALVVARVSGAVVICGQKHNSI